MSDEELQALVTGRGREAPYLYASLNANIWFEGQIPDEPGFALPHCMLSVVQPISILPAACRPRNATLAVSQGYAAAEGCFISVSACGARPTSGVTAVSSNDQHRQESLWSSSSALLFLSFVSRCLICSAAFVVELNPNPAVVRYDQKLYY